MKKEKSKYVSNKVRKIMMEGKGMKEAVAIALSLYRRKYNK